MIGPYYLRIIFSSLSLLSLAAVLVLFYVVRRRVSNFFVKLGIYLMLADLPLLISAYVNLSIPEPQFLCDLTAIFRQFSNLSTMLWNILIVWTVYTTIVNNLGEEHFLLFKRKFLILTFIIPLLLSIIPIIVGKCISDSHSSCNVSTTNSTRSAYILYDGTYLLCYFVSVIIIVRHYIRMFFFLREYTIEEVSGEFYPLSLFPIVLIIANIFDVVNRFSVILLNEEWGKQVGISFRCSQVFINSVLFTLNPKVWVALRRYCSRRMKKKNRDDNLLSLQASLDIQASPGNNSDGNSDEVSSSGSKLSNSSVSKDPARKFTANPDLISKFFDVKTSPVKGQLPSKAAGRRSTNYY